MIYILAVEAVLMSVFLMVGIQIGIRYERKKKLDNQTGI